MLCSQQNFLGQARQENEVPPDLSLAAVVQMLVFFAPKAHPDHHETHEHTGCLGDKTGQVNCSRSKKDDTRSD